MNSINTHERQIIDPFNQQVLLLLNRPLTCANKIFEKAFEQSFPNSLSTRSVKKLEELLPPLPILILEDTPFHILYEIPGGKPNPKEPLLLGCNDNRNQIEQSSQKGRTCWYYAFARLRHRIGKNPPEELAQYRFIEKATSELRKMFTHEKNISLETYYEYGREVGCSFSTYLKPAIDLYKKSDQYLINKNPSAAMNAIRMHYAISIGLKLSSWKPQNGIDGLMIELREKGPMALFGNFGFAFYEQPPVKCSMINGREIFTLEGAKKLESASHVVVVVGAAKIQNHGIVFYIDPNDKSSPYDRKAQKIYAMLYEQELIPNVFNAMGLRENHSLAHEFPWGYHGHFNLPNQSKSRVLAQSA